MGENSEIGYAAYVLNRIGPPKGSTMLGLGCADGLMIHAMLMLRPDLHIDGIEQALASSGETKILPSGVYYRLDIVQKITR
jgi:hypothetical protein